MEIVKLSSKGQIVIPAWLRKELGLSEGDKLLIERRQEEVILKPMVKLSKLRGIDKLEGTSDEIDKIRKEWNDEFEKFVDASAKLKKMKTVGVSETETKKEREGREEKAGFEQYES